MSGIEIICSFLLMIAFTALLFLINPFIGIGWVLFITFIIIVHIKSTNHK